MSAKSVREFPSTSSNLQGIVNESVGSLAPGTVPVGPVAKESEVIAAPWCVHRTMFRPGVSRIVA